MTTRLLLYLLISYALLCLLVFVIQRNLLYLADQAPLPPEAARKAGLRPWPAPERFQGFIGEPEPAVVRGTVIVFHGNAGAAYHRAFYIRALARMGLRVILAEYPGYGGRAGRPSEKLLVEDALAAIGHAHTQYGEPLYLWGESLGCGVVAAALRQTEVPVRGAVLFLPWDSLADVAQTHYWYLPARWLVLDRYDSIENLRHYTGKVAVLLAGEDEVIPVRHGRRLYDSLTASKRLWLFEGVRHNEMPIDPDLAWWGEVVAFLAP
jgi:fermentation-respiration switch protein FrsA (DUF1100 family)